MFPDMIAVEALFGYQLLITFENNEKKCFDMKPYLNAKVFEPLQNVGFFKLARVDYGTVVWTDEIDIAPETLYEHSVLI